MRARHGGRPCLELGNPKEEYILISTLMAIEGITDNITMRTCEILQGKLSYQSEYITIL